MTVNELVEDMKQKASKGLLAVSGTGKSSERTWTFPNGHAEVMVVKGGAIDKAAIQYMSLQGVTRVRQTGDFDGVVLHIVVFPENPYCPMGNLIFEGITKGTRRYYMNLDLFPAVRVEEDLAAMKAAMDAVADRFERDREVMREGLDTLYTMEHFPAPLTAKVGCKLLLYEEEDLNFLAAAYDTFLSVYLDIISKRKGISYTESDVHLKLERNGRWLQLLVLREGEIRFAQNQGMPPEIIVEMGFPPSAIF